MIILMRNFIVIFLVMLFSAGLSQAIAGERVCNDATFLRRLYLNTTGELPSVEVTEAFLSSKSKDKRQVLIKEVINTEAHSRYFLMRLGDILRVKSEFPSNLWPNGVQAYNRWLLNHLMENTPYDAVVSELLMSKGSNFKQPAVNFYRAFQDRDARNVYANIHLLFMGEQRVADSLYVCFSQMKYKPTKEWKEEIVYPDVWKEVPSKVYALPNGKKIEFNQHEDWRADYVEWLVSDKNRRFAEAMVNRVWYWIMGKGLVTEPDPEIWPKKVAKDRERIMNHLVDNFVERGYDLKALTEEILSSRYFQCVIGDTTYFKQQRLPAEVIVDEIARQLGLSDVYQSRVPEPFTFYPENTPSRDLGDATVSSPTLELFGKTSRDVSLESQRDNSVSDRQLLYLMNSNDLEMKIRKSPIVKDLAKRAASYNELLNEAFLRLLCRRPTEKEKALFLKYSKKNKLNKFSFAYDIYWTVINSNEFLFNY